MTYPSSCLETRIKAMKRRKWGLAAGFFGLELWVLELLPHLPHLPDRGDLLVAELWIL